MNREILFRGKRADNNGWAEGLLTVMWGQYHIINPSDENTAYPIAPETVCQYTGLTDKNGRKIFEGDIIKEDFGKIVGIIKFGIYDSKHYGFYIYWTGNCYYRNDIYYWHQEGNIEIIGNISDNPELLKES